MPLLMCPNCNVGTQQLVRSDVQIDMCPQCRGVWLDRGELEKILDYERTPAPRADGPWGDPRAQHDVRRYGDGARRDHDDDDDHRYGRKRRRSIFDIFD